MLIYIGSNIIIKNSPKLLKDVLVEELKLPNPKYTTAIENGFSTWGIDPNIYNFSILPDNSIVIPRGYKKRLLSLIDYFSLKPKIEDNRNIFPFETIDSRHINYRPLQLQAIIQLVSSGQEGILVAPPGGGKTVMGLSLIPMLGQPTLWLTHTDRLAKQTLERVRTFLPSLKDEDKGYIGNGKWVVGNILTVAMVQTLNRRPEETAKLSERFGLVILDEAHHCPATTFLSTISNFNSYYRYGLTATPYRSDKMEKLMFQSLGDETVRISIQQLEQAGSIIIPTIKYRAISSKNIDGNNVQEILKKHIVPNKKRNGLIAGDVIREAIEGNFCIVVTDRKLHAELLYDLIRPTWPKTGIATGNYSRKYIDEQVNLFENNEITVLICTFQLLGEGFDISFLNRGFITMPFRAEGKVEQLIGRIQRIAPGKKDAIVYDYVDINIGVLRSQFYTSYGKDCRYNCYERLGVHIEPY